MFSCVMAVYDIKDSVSTCKHWKNKKHRWLHPNYGIRVSYFRSGYLYKSLEISTTKTFERMISFDKR